MSTRTHALAGTAPPTQAGRPGTAGLPARRRLGLALVVIATAQLMVVLDASIVNVALPHIQRALGFSGTNLEWVVNAYALAFGGLLLLGGRAGDLLGRRKVFIAGIIAFSAASLAGGFATSQAWLLDARAVQGAGAAVTAPTALSLVTTTFPEGRPRDRAMGVPPCACCLLPRSPGPWRRSRTGPPERHQPVRRFVLKPGPTARRIR